MTNQPTTPRRFAASILKGAAALTLSLTAAAGMAQTAGSYSLTNIISDGYVPATVTDPNFIDPWGISGPTDFWIDTAVTGYSYVNFANGAIQFKTTIPAQSSTAPPGSCSPMDRRRASCSRHSMAPFGDGTASSAPLAASR